MSLVELMVGIAVGLIVVAGASVVVSSQLVDNRALLLETKMVQDLRASADLLVRDVRRTGFVRPELSMAPDPLTAFAVTQDVSPGNRLVVPANAAGKLYYSYARDNVNGNFGFFLDNDYVLQTCQTNTLDFTCSSQGALTWQAITDPAVMVLKDSNGNAGISYSTVRADVNRAKPANDNRITLPCPSLCADGTTACWPKVGINELSVTLKGRSTVDASVVREVTESIKVRNESVTYGGTPDVPAGRACPVT